MSSLVKPDHWKYYLGDMPMPEGATPDMMWAAYDAIEELKGVDDTLENIKLYEKMRDDYIFYHKDAENSAAVKWYNEIIDFYREKLNG